jgi:predicted negative regulator of RcsB-dependent stress response
MANYAKGSGSGLALLGLAVAGMFAWRKRDQITAAAKDASAKLNEAAKDASAKINEKVKAARDGSDTGSTTPNANDIPVSNAV